MRSGSLAESPEEEAGPDRFAAAEAPTCRSGGALGPARGLMLGVVLGAALWIAIIVLISLLF